ncbi:penicillin-insensitive murein endopeptidase [Pseudoalteromonas sp. C2R02]|uniref:penicillin-insensitive murein endopeptidase n=1 Tax=Pseudoalteromonas sp. C2R02 TaxID=2841565 RepID=UPI001C091673|nr:penicillin-insensitive murein endopeptidase [Pseudoalteromonas sp. C2R02]MBU2972362.1 penicillin-insensitive murein endopeptidase [Pseudoalteromonas sp. C2R02]
MFYHSFCKINLILIMVLSVNHAFSFSWQDFSTVSNHKPDAVGTYNNGCLLGGAVLPETGEGFQVIRTSRNRFYGHPNLINFIQSLAIATKAQGLDDLLIADMSMPRGGNFKSGHASHQTGLDVDIWLRSFEKKLSLKQRETVEKLDVVNKKQFTVKTAIWDPDHITLIKVAAKSEQVARIFVSPVIKQKLCDMAFIDDGWLNKVRPWWGHSYHIHVRLRCPKESNDCKNQKQVADTNGCKELNWWRNQFTKPAKKSIKKPMKKKIKIKPEQCQALLSNK